MKSSNQHKIRSPEKLEEDMTDILWAAAAGAGLWGLAKGWDKWGKDAAASLPFATKGMKAAKIDRAKEKKDQKISDAQKIADDPNSSAKDKEDAEKVLDKEMSAVDKAERDVGKKEKVKGDKATIAKGVAANIGDEGRDEHGNLKNAEDAQAYRDGVGEAPPGWATSNGKVPDGAKPKPAKGKVWTTDQEDEWTEAEDDRKEAEKVKKDAETGETETKLVPKGTKMTITESNELQAIMALGDEGIDAEINRKGQVVVKKKDLKKAQKALKKSFKKGGEPKLVGEELHRTAYELVSEARAKVIKNKPKWEPEDSEPRLS